MIVILKDQSNIVVLTLTEKASLSNPYWLFCLSHDETKREYCFIANDSSSYPERFNQFHITEKNNPDTLNNEVNLPYDGFYSYTVYEQSSSSNLDPAIATAIVEIGKCKVTSDTSESTIEFSSTPSNVVFNG